MRPAVQSWTRRLATPRQFQMQLLRTSSPSSPKYLSSSPSQFQDGQLHTSPTTDRPLDPNLVSTRAQEKRLLETGVRPIGSRRRRAALASSPNIPFQELPYQCFQEALKVLQEDRQKKIGEIEVERGRIERVKAQDARDRQTAHEKEVRLRSMNRHLERLKVLADINDPLVKKAFEDGHADMNKPVYRHLADKKWRSRRRLILNQRITQMHVIPDVLPNMDLTADVALYFGRKEIPPGGFVPSKVSEIAPKVSVQVFDRGERFVSVAVIDSDVPNVEKDGFDHRCHFLAANVPISPTATRIPLAELSEETQMILPWTPPFAQKGSPYHRISVFIMEQKDGKEIDVSTAREKVTRERFSLRRFVTFNPLQPVGAYMFRTQWDEGTDDIMRRLGYEGVEMELKAKKIEPLPYRWKPKWSERYR